MIKHRYSFSIGSFKEYDDLNLKVCEIKLF